MAALRAPRAFAEAIERVEALDAAGKALGKTVRGLVGPGAAKDAISGTWLGHAVHPPLTDVVIGSFLSASLLDLTTRDSGEAAERLLQMGSSPPCRRPSRGRATGPTASRPTSASGAWASCTPP